MKLHQLGLAIVLGAAAFGAQAASAAAISPGPALDAKPLAQLVQYQWGSRSYGYDDDYDDRRDEMRRRRWREERWRREQAERENWRRGRSYYQQRDDDDD